MDQDRAADRRPDAFRQHVLIDMVGFDPPGGVGLQQGGQIGQDVADPAPHAGQQQIGVRVPIPHRVEIVARLQPRIDRHALLHGQQGIGVSTQKSLYGRIGHHVEPPQQFAMDGLAVRQPHFAQLHAAAGKRRQVGLVHRRIVVDADRPGREQMRLDPRIFQQRHLIARLIAPKAVGDHVFGWVQRIEHRRQTVGDADQRRPRAELPIFRIQGGSPRLHGQVQPPDPVVGVGQTVMHVRAVRTAGKRALAGADRTSHIADAQQENAQIFMQCGVVRRDGQTVTQGDDPIIEPFHAVQHQAQEQIIVGGPYSQRLGIGDDAALDFVGLV